MLVALQFGGLHDWHFLLVVVLSLTLVVSLFY